MTHSKWQTKNEFPGSISLPYGVKTSHTWHEVGQILRIINDYNVYSFAELGCHVGGLASVLIPRSRYHPFRYIGFEINGSLIDEQVKENCLILIRDIFKDSVDIWRCAKNLKTFIYCDNGNKVEEMQTFAQFLEPGDIIACHDYWNGQDVVDLPGFGISNECGCRPEVFYVDITFLLDDDTFEILPYYLLEGTRIIGFIKR